MISKSFDCFTVYKESDNNVFIHIDIKNDHVLYEKLFDYFFSEEKLLRYCENNKHISSCPSSKAYTILYRHLRTYIDSEKEKMPLPVFAQEIEQILAIEKIITIAHGTELDENEVINEMKKIPRKKCWGCLRYIIVFLYKKKYFRSYT